MLILPLKSNWVGAFLVAQWLRVCLPMQGTRVRALVWEDPTCCGATRPVSHNYWACASGACAPNKRGRDSERPAHRDEGWPPLAATPSHRNEDPTQPKINKLKKKKKSNWVTVRPLLSLWVSMSSYVVKQADQHCPCHGWCVGELSWHAWHTVCLHESQLCYDYISSTWICSLF